MAVPLYQHLLVGQLIPQALKFLTALAFCILASLGTWQVYRLHWKNDLIRQYTHQQSLPPRDLDTLSSLEPFQRALVKGVFVPAPPLFLSPRVYHRQVGGHVLVPFRTLGGQIFLVNLGWQEKLGPLSLEKTTLDVTVRSLEKPGYFTPHNTPGKNQWTTLDLSAMGAHWNIPLNTQWYLEARDSLGPHGPIPLGSEKTFLNNHLSYALTWYALAILVVVFAVFSQRRV